MVMVQRRRLAASFVADNMGTMSREGGSKDIHGSRGPVRETHEHNVRALEAFMAKLRTESQRGMRVRSR